MAASIRRAMVEWPAVGVIEEKAELRRAMARSIRGIPREERREQSSGICSAIRELSFWRQSDALWAFVPLSDEPDIEALLVEAQAQGKKVGLPRVECAGTDRREGAALGFRLFAGGRPGALQRNRRLGFREPAADSEPFVRQATDRCLILVPGRAFDEGCRRLGRGGGHYDRFLETMRSAGGPTMLAVVGVAFEQQIVKRLPQEATDHSVDMVVTPSRIIGVGVFSSDE